MPHTRIAVIGGGPAGLRAAEVASAEGVQVVLFDAQRSVGRKFLVAGKGGLNLTNEEEPGVFATRFHGPGQPEGFWARALERFDNRAIRSWAARLDVGTFAARNGRVYPKALKAAPLLRRWVQRLKAQGVEFQVRHRLGGLTPGSPHELRFETPEGGATWTADAVILGMGGGSWPQTGSDGRWLTTFDRAGIATRPLSPANCGWDVAWPDGFPGEHEGSPLKNLLLSAGGSQAVGELVITRHGLEGGPLYILGPALRDSGQPVLTIDFKPTFPQAKLVAKMESARRNFLHEAQLRWKLPPAACDLIEATHGPIESAGQLAGLVKAYELPLSGPRPIEEAISSAGGVRWSEVDDSLMLHRAPGLFVAGEMIDWEAPTGGYLIQGCFTTGTLAAESAVAWLNR